MTNNNLEEIEPIVTNTPEKVVKVSDVVAWVEGNAIISISDTERLLHHLKQYLNELP